MVWNPSNMYVVRANYEVSSVELAFLKRETKGCLRTSGGEADEPFRTNQTMLQKALVVETRRGFSTAEQKQRVVTSVRPHLAR
ncbi:hypothetical protein SARC_05526 [Sphaeroforma arctica JP610]|uniref:Uncharacterized protein n=1 Tax=Sphaeroforma arctica JP610 TaxID=667725 RepID=A0A0L0FZC7_9EUKA|nr:hypothetical protein SARC_05526 [Sphaeroforma arctica JP610]KNC82187.1 hypothetical protein SARC_05526 [Sphaeroforma arctica JP610]|eukprot:XP_014156089.1 hypothetical protein SARC_05526 [Sphaeroforma arctica JP610]